MKLSAEKIVEHLNHLKRSSIQLSALLLISEDLFILSDSFICLGTDKFKRYSNKIRSVLKEINFLIYENADCSVEEKNYENYMDASKQNYLSIIPMARTKGLHEAKIAYINLVKQEIVVLQKNLVYLENFYNGIESSKKNYIIQKKILESLFTVLEEMMSELHDTPIGYLYGNKTNLQYYAEYELP